MNKCNQKFIYLIFLACISWEVSAQKVDISKLQQQVEATVSKTRGTSVFITDYDPKTKSAYGGRFSGVIVSEDGIILTVAHATNTNQTYQVTFIDGKKYTATGLGRVSSIGLAMLKINEKGKWPVAEMGWSATLKANEPCISIAYPASFDNEIPVVRFGYVAEVSSATQANRIRTTCLMEPGDSGGPVFDLSGRVIGMNNNVNMSLDANFEVPIDLYRKYWNALLQAEDYRDSPIGESLSPDTIRKVPHIFSDITLYGNSMVETAKKFDRTVIRIVSTMSDKKIFALGTIINFKGATYVLSKSSIVGEKAVLEMSKDRVIETVFAYRDESKDLVLLKVIGASIQGIPYADIAKGAAWNLAPGEFLCSPLAGGEASWSVIGSEKFDLEAKFRAGYSGAGTVMKHGKLVLEIVQSGTGGSEADLKIGDEILAIDGKVVQDPDSYIAEIRKKQPGELITMTRISNGKKEVVNVRLGKFPVITPNHPASFFAGGRSGIRDGFNQVYVHDSRLTPAECGGPVFDLQGRFIGINIARYSRVSNVLLSASEVAEFMNAVQIQ